MDKVKYIKDVRIITDKDEPRIMAIKATGVAELKHLLSPVLRAASNPDQATQDGIFELDFVLGDSGNIPAEVDIELDVVFKFKNMPEWVKGIKINARENSDIELIL